MVSTQFAEVLAILVVTEYVVIATNKHLVAIKASKSFETLPIDYNVA